MLKKVFRMNLQDALNAEELASSRETTMEAEILALEKTGLCSRQYVLTVDKKLRCRLNHLATGLYIAGIATAQEDNCKYS